jgi:branched-chain amino acid transport system ATP-binding protein
MSALVLKAVRKSFGLTQVIRGTDLEINPHERVALIGPNGAGKSTLFALISGQLAPDDGKIFMNGVDMTGKPPHQMARAGLGRSFQVSNLFWSLTVRDNLTCAAMWASGQRLGMLARRQAASVLTQRVDGLLDTLGLTERAQVKASELSYAEQRVLEIGMTVASEPQCLLLDEPTAGMSKAETHRVIELIKHISTGRTLVIIEHDMNVVFNLADRIAVLVYGRVLAFGSPAAIRSNSEVQSAYLGQHASQSALPHA